jgi:hypothetical protein
LQFIDPAGDFVTADDRASNVSVASNRSVSSRVLCGSDKTSWVIADAASGPANAGHRHPAPMTAHHWVDAHGLSSTTSPWHAPTSTANPRPRFSLYGGTTCRSVIHRLFPTSIKRSPTTWAPRSMSPTGANRNPTTPEGRSRSGDRTSACPLVPLGDRSVSRTKFRFPRMRPIKPSVIPMTSQQLC